MAATFANMDFAKGVGKNVVIKKENITLTVSQSLVLDTGLKNIMYFKIHRGTYSKPNSSILAWNIAEPTKILGDTNASGSGGYQHGWADIPNSTSSNTMIINDIDVENGKIYIKNGTDSGYCAGQFEWIAIGEE